MDTKWGEDVQIQALSILGLYLVLSIHMLRLTMTQRIDIIFRRTLFTGISQSIS